MNLNELTETLIDISSVTGDEKEIINFIEEYLTQNKFTGEIIKNEGGLIAYHSKTDSKIALVGHLDTVPIDKEQNRSTDSDNIFGRGSVDMKAGIAVMLNALLDDGSNEIGVFYTAEEGPINQNGLEVLMPILQNDFNIEFAIIMEPTNLECQLGCLGTLNAELKIKGVSSHSARPWIGDNPIYKLNEVLEYLKKNEIEDHLIEGLDFKQTLAATRINGGIANNVIPSEVTLNINFRFLPTLSNEEAIKEIEGKLKTFGEVSIVDVANGAMPNSKSNLVQEFIKATNAKVTSKQAWTDIARFTNINIPAVNYGPGDPLLAHTVNEFINKNQILESYKLLNEYLKSYR